MRSDFNEVLASRPRVGGQKAKKTKHGGRERMRPRFVDTKERRILLGPFKRFLRSKVGQLWNDVYSEICRCDRSNKSQDIHYLVKRLITFPVLVDGKLYDGSYEFEAKTSFKYFVFYVDPNDGKIKEQEYIKPKNKTRKKIFYQVENDLFYHFDDIWYRVKMKEIDKNSGYVPNSIWMSPVCQDVFSNTTLDKARAAYGLSPNGLYWYCKKKESASHKEIKKLKILYPDG